MPAQLVAALTGAQQQLARLGLATVTTALAGPLGDLSAVAGALPLGTALAGLHTVGVDVSLLGLRTDATYHRSQPATTGGGTGDGTGGSGNGGSGNGGSGNGGSGNGGGGAGPTADDPTTDDPADDSGPSDAPPVSPPSVPTTEASPTPDLPFTGANAAVELAAAMVLLVVGAHLLVVGRRPREA